MKTDRLQLTPTEWISIYEDCESSIDRGMPWDINNGYELYKFETTTVVRGGIEVCISGFLKTDNNGKTFSIDRVAYFEVMNADPNILGQDCERELIAASERHYRHTAYFFSLC